MRRESDRIFSASPLVSPTRWILSLADRKRREREKQTVTGKCVRRDDIIHDKRVKAFSQAHCCERLPLLSLLFYCFLVTLNGHISQSAHLRRKSFRVQFDYPRGISELWMVIMIYLTHSHTSELRWLMSVRKWMCVGHKLNINETMFSSLFFTFVDRWIHMNHWSITHRNVVHETVDNEIEAQSMCNWWPCLSVWESEQVWVKWKCHIT